MRKIIPFNEGWKFVKSNEEQAVNRDFNDQEWHEVTIPHTWNAVDGANGFDYYQGACWYRKEFMVDPVEENNRLFIEFNGANSVVNVYVNGTHMGEHRGGYSTFRFDITDAVQFNKKNVLSVKVDNSIVEDVYPLMADFTFYGGIYRDVNLVVTNQVHFDLMDDGAQGVYIVQDCVTEDRAEMTIQARLVNANDTEKKIRVWADLLDQGGRVVTYGAKEVVLEAGETKKIDIHVAINDPVLWNGRKNPYMYQAVVSLQSLNDTLDELRIPVGVRYFEVDPEKGFILNGKPLRLNGVSRHQDRKDKGWAISKEDHLEDMEFIKEIGASSIRLAHYQHDQFFYDLCDEEGMVVWAEIPFISKMSKTDLEGTNAKQQMAELVKQNFNHPSIMFWGIQNEIQIGGERPELRKLVSELNDMTKEMDPTRLTTMANVMFVDEKDDYNHVTDVLGFNKYYGWYIGEVGGYADWLDEFYAENKNTVSLSISEYGAEGIIEYHSSTPKIKDYTEEYHALYHEKAWEIFEARPSLWATYVWNMFDFGANIRNEGGVQGRNNKGLMTYDRKVKKDAFYMYKAHWSDEKFVHITSKRFVDRSEENITIKIYSNCDEVTLYVNGEKHSTQSGNKVLNFENVMLADDGAEIRVTATDGTNIYEDFARFNKVAVPNPSYLASEDSGGPVENWFEVPGLEDIVVEEIKITDDVYSTRNSFKELLENGETKVVIDKYLPDLENNEMFEMIIGMNIDNLKDLAPNIFNKQLLYLLNRELTKIKK